MILQEYLESFWPDLHAAHELYASIAQTLQERESDGAAKEYSEHLPAEVMEAGIKSGRYIQVRASCSNQCCIHRSVQGKGPLMLVHPSLSCFKGTLSVNKHRSQHEAFVRYEGSASKNAGSQT